MQIIFPDYPYIVKSGAYGAVIYMIIKILVVRQIFHSHVCTLRSKRK